MAGYSEAGRRLAAIALLCDIYGFSLTLVATIGPAWLTVDNGRQQWTLQEGIWVARYCDKTACKVFARQHILKEVGRDKYFPALDESHWDEFKVLSVLGIISSLVAVLTTTVMIVRKSSNHQVPVLIVGGVTALATSMFFLVPVLKTFTVDSNVSDTKSWTRLVASVCILLHFLATICYVFAVYQNMQYGCAVKRRERLHRRRLELVVRYLSSQTDNCEIMEPNNTRVQPVNAVSRDLMTVNSASGFVSSGFSGLQPYVGNTRLPLYHEVASE